MIPTIYILPLLEISQINYGVSLALEAFPALRSHLLVGSLIMKISHGDIEALSN